MKVTRQSSNAADAVQWQGTSQSLAEIQALLAPASPLYDGDFDQQLEYRSLGVMVTKAHLPSSPRLEHVSPGGWVVKDGEVVMIMSDEQFKRSYVAMQVGEVVWVPPSPEKLMATHPRVIAAEKALAGDNTLDVDDPPF